jgi:hypothetical protein
VGCARVVRLGVPLRPLARFRDLAQLRQRSKGADATQSQAVRVVNAK